MKKVSIYLIAICSIILFSCSQEENGFIPNEESTSLESIVNTKLFIMQNGILNEVTTEFLKAKWEREIKEDEGININLQTFEIIPVEDGIENNNFFLLAKSDDGTIQTGAFINKDKTLAESLGVNGDAYLLQGKTCTCKGCSQGCDLTVSGSTCFCSSCPPWGPQDCVKTEKIVIDTNE